MNKTHGRRAAWRSLAASVLAAACSASAMAADYTSSVIATGLNSPRGLAFAPDGALWVTEAGVAGTSGPFTLVRGAPQYYNESGSLTRIAGGSSARVVTGLPALGSGAEVSGVSDIAFMSSGMYALTIGMGANPAVRSTDLAPGGSQLARLVGNGSSIDLGAHEVSQNPAGGPIDSNPWNLLLLPGDGGAVVTDAGANSLLYVAPDGSITTVTTFPGRDIGGGFPSDAVPTGLAFGPDGRVYVGQLTGFPFSSGQAQIYRVEEDGTQSVYATGFTMVTDITFDSTGNLYVLEYDSNGLLAPGSTGGLWKVDTLGNKSLLFSTGLEGATGLTIGPDGAFYVSNHGTGAGAGEVLRIAPVPEPATVALMLAGLLAVGVAAHRRRG